MFASQLTLDSSNGFASCAYMLGASRLTKTTEKGICSVHVHRAVAGLYVDCYAECWSKHSYTVSYHSSGGPYTPLLHKAQALGGTETDHASIWSHLRKRLLLRKNIFGNSNPQDAALYSIGMIFSAETESGSQGASDSVFT